jgi:hypothetical protein
MHGSRATAGATALLAATALVLLAGRMAHVRRTDLMYRPVQAPLVELADADAGGEPAGFLPFLPEDVSEGTAKKLATMDRMVQGWTSRSNPLLFRSDYLKDSDRVAEAAVQDAIADMQREEREEVRYAGQTWPKGLPYRRDAKSRARVNNMQKAAAAAREEAVAASLEAGGDPQEPIEKAPEDLRWIRAARIAQWEAAGEETAATRAALEEGEAPAEELVFPREEYPTYEDHLARRAADVAEAEATAAEAAEDEV